jgi:DNA (cytosine-5)-methyltransferase 1
MRNLFDMTAGGAPQDEIVVDLFAGGGGASEGIRIATGKNPAAAVNHNPKAVAMHKANHPDTVHFTNDVWSVSPSWVTKGRPVGLLWASPDCTHFSKAKGGAPIRCDKIRSLAMVLVDKWIPEVRPRVIIMENVEEFTTWGPLDSRGRIIETAKGDTFRQFINRLRRAGYRVEWKELRACDYGAPTIRKRLFLIARCDGQPIAWPEPTHGDPKGQAVQSGELLPWRTAADCIDWSIPCPSIFDASEDVFQKYGVRAKRPLAEKTLKRIAEGIKRYVLEAAEPFIVKANHTASYYNCFRGQGVDEPLQTVTKDPGFSLVAPYLTEHANSSNQRNMAAADPLRTQCAQVKGGHFAVVFPFLEAHYAGKGSKAMRLPDIQAPMRTVPTENRFGLVSPTLIQTGYGEREGQSPRVPGLDKPLGTAVAGGVKHALVSGFLAKHFTGVVGTDLDKPAPTVTTRDHNSVVSSSLVKMRGTNVGQPTDEPLHTVSAGGLHHAEVRAFLCKYYGQGIGQEAGGPMHTVTAQDRFGLVTVEGEEYVIADIGMRMLQPRELYRAQGFPDTYIIDHDADGNKMTKTDQVRMCGNSVCPPMAAALVRANVELRTAETAAA